MTTNEFLELTTCVITFGKVMHNQLTRPRVKCADGYSISIQASSYCYSHPRLDGADWYDQVELGFPSKADELINSYAEDDDYTHTVYGYVPVAVVDKLLEKHGGIVEFIFVEAQMDEDFIANWSDERFKKYTEFAKEAANRKSSEKRKKYHFTKNETVTDGPDIFKENKKEVEE